ncbi:MAG TPA: glycosyltransferase [Burkholderiaceae bacterium]|jgi:4-amino-4-deoxy-L-arabinose transferase-like glycosyltransferase|nr:glycosyltransferase [Burkholderiaceae bacterium]
MKPVRLPASATNALPRWAMIALCMLYILPGLIARDPWKNLDAASFGIEWTMAHGNLSDWLWPHIGNLTMPEEGPLAFWLGAICIRLFGWLVGDPMAARIASICFFVVGSLSVWYATFLLGRRAEAQPLRLAFGGQPEAKDYGRTLADGALLIYLGCLGLLLPVHATSPKALQVSLVAYGVYLAIRLFDSPSRQAAIKLGLTLGLLVLTRGWVVPLALWLSLVVLALVRERSNLIRLIFLSLPAALAVAGAWLAAIHFTQPFDSSPVPQWLAWNINQIAWPTWESVKYLFKYGIWFAWPAWPFAGWAVYAWRKQFKALHIALPLALFCALVVLCVLNPNSEVGILMPLLPLLAILAAFGLPTMKRGAINAVDWFSVMVLTILAFGIWMYWISLQTGWPLPAQKVLKLLPGFKPEFHILAFVIALGATFGWIFLVHWRISRHPSVLWRAVVLSSGGGILCWLLWMTLWLPASNYAKSYANVAAEIAQKLPEDHPCVDTNVGADQLASFAYFGQIKFSQFDQLDCPYLLLQENGRNKGAAERIQNAGDQWQLMWEGRRPHDKDERFRLYKRMR